MKNMTYKMIAALLLMTSLMTLPTKAMAFEIVEVTATHKEYVSAPISARTEKDSIRAVKLHQDGTLELWNQRGYDQGLELETTIFVPVTFTVSRNGQVLKTVSIDKMFSSVVIPSEELEQR